jgi:hypothetical protein
MKFHKKSELGFKIFLIIAVLLVGVWIYGGMLEHKTTEKYLNSLGLQLTGTVSYVDAPANSNGFGIIGVRAIYSNKMIVDTAITTKYCVIRNDSAEFYQIGAGDCVVGDTIEVDTNKRIFIIGKATGEIKTEDVVVYENEFFWKYVKKHTKFH